MKATKRGEDDATILSLGEGHACGHLQVVMLQALWVVSQNRTQRTSPETNTEPCTLAGTLPNPGPRDR